jgi:hypothetical protein
MSSFRTSLAFASLAGVVLASGAYAQDMRDKLTLPIPEGLNSEVAHFPRGAPGTSSGSPIAFGANLHDVFIGVGLQSPVRYGNAADGGATVGFGLGNAVDYVGLEVDISPLSIVRSSVVNRVGFGGKLHKTFGDNWGVAVGITNIVANSDADDGKPSVYGVLSKVIDLRDSFLHMFPALTLSAGAGDRGFRLEKDIRSAKKTVGFFGSAALRVHEQVSLIADWDGQDLGAAVSIVPIRDFPLVITPGVADLTGSAGTFNTSDAVRPRFTLGVGTAFRW